MLPRRHILLPFGHVVFLFVSPVSAGVPSGNHLIMVTASDCPWCEAFEDEVGRGYPNTEEAKLLPLRDTISMIQCQKIWWTLCLLR